jgi:hypothetical protein
MTARALASGKAPPERGEFSDAVVNDLQDLIDLNHAIPGHPVARAIVGFAD